MKMLEVLQSELGTTTLLETCEVAVAVFLPEARNSTGRCDVVSLCKKKNIPLELMKTANFEGRFSQDVYGRPKIAIRSASNAQRMRFTIAHELGHWVIAQLLRNKACAAYRGKPMGTDAMQEEERIADTLAAEILMPVRIMRQYLGHKMTYALAGRGAAELDVSQLAFLKRWCDLTGTAFLRLAVLPAVFSDLSSNSIVDDAWLLKPNFPSERKRESVRFARMIPFDKIEIARKGIRVRIDGAENTWSFDVSFQTGVIPKANLCTELTPKESQQLGRSEIATS